jgi:deoxyribonuclease-4
VFGSHLSIAGSVANALREARALGLDCVQVFTKNQQQWNAPPLSPDAVGQWAAERRALGWATAPGAPDRVVSHASYLANLASPDPALHARSLALMREELARCETLDIPLLVFHPGAAVGCAEDEAEERIASACRELLRAPGRTVLCLENVAGQGSTVGRTLEQLARLRARAIDAGAPPERLAFCLDSCHAHAGGYDLSTRSGAEDFVARVDRTITIAGVRVLHLNDSKGAAGSRVDRHQHIGEGTIGLAGFQVLVNTPGWAQVPKIMETPKGRTGGVAWDSINVARLRSLVGRSDDPGTVRDLIGGGSAPRGRARSNATSAATGRGPAARRRGSSGSARVPAPVRRSGRRAPAKGRAAHSGARSAGGPSGGKRRQPAERSGRARPTRRRPRR